MLQREFKSGVWSKWLRSALQKPHESWNTGALTVITPTGQQADACCQHAHGPYRNLESFSVFLSQGEGCTTLSQLHLSPFQLCRNCWLSYFSNHTAPLPSSSGTPTTISSKDYAKRPPQKMRRGFLWQHKPHPQAGAYQCGLAPGEWVEGNILREYTYIKGIEFSWLTGHMLANTVLATHSQSKEYLSTSNWSHHLRMVCVHRQPHICFVHWCILKAWHNSWHMGGIQ